jgi:hypothetical protein
MLILRAGRLRLTAVSVAMLALNASDAQTPAATNAVKHPIRTVRGEPALPRGWLLRFDPLQQPAQKSFQVSEVRFLESDNSLLVESGPAAIYYRPVDRTSGDFSIAATFTHSKSIGHEAFGMFFGGSHLQDSTQRYLYFVIRTQGGAFLVSKREGDQPPTPIVPWTESPAIAESRGRLGASTNKLMIRARGDSVFFLANGTRVASISLAATGFTSAGDIGLRVNHNIGLRVEDFRITRP